MVQFRVWLQGIFVVLTVVIHVNENEELNTVLKTKIIEPTELG